MFESPNFVFCTVEQGSLYVSRRSPASPPLDMFYAVFFSHHRRVAGQNKLKFANHSRLMPSKITHRDSDASCIHLPFLALPGVPSLPANVLFCRDTYTKCARRRSSAEEKWILPQFLIVRIYFYLFHRLVFRALHVARTFRQVEHAHHGWNINIKLHADRVAGVDLPGNSLPREI